MALDISKFNTEVRAEGAKHPVFAKMALMFEQVADAINQTASAAGVDATQHVSPPDAPSAIGVKSGNGVAHVTLTDNSPRSRARNYFVEADTDPNFSAPHVVHMGVSREAFVALPGLDDNGDTQHWHFRGYSMDPGSAQRSPMQVLGGATPTAVDVGGQAQFTPLQATGSGTASTTGQQGGQGFGHAQFTAESRVAPVQATVPNPGNGILPVALGGSGTATPSLVGGSGVTISGDWPNQTVAASGGGSGTVTEVDTAGIASGGPITTSGTITVTGSGDKTTAVTDAGSIAGGTSGDVVTCDGDGNVQDSGTLLSSLLASPLTTKGDLLYEDATPAAARLAIGTSGQVLGVSSGLPAWTDLPQSANSISEVSHKWLDSYDASTGDFTQSQPAFSDISGSITSGQQPSTTVNSVSDDTNVTGSISAQELTLGWTGTLAVARGGTGSSSPSLTAGSNISITGTWPDNTIALVGNSAFSGNQLTVGDGASESTLILNDTTGAKWTIATGSYQLSFTADDGTVAAALNDSGHGSPYDAIFHAAIRAGANCYIGNDTQAGIYLTNASATAHWFMGENLSSGAQGAWFVYNAVSGNLPLNIATDDGITVNSPTGGSKGAGTINVSSGIYKNGTAYTNPDYVLEKWATGKIEKCAENPGADGYVMRTLAEVEAFARATYELPRVAERRELFSRADVLLEKVEEIFIHLFEIDKRLRTLEGRMA